MTLIAFADPVFQSQSTFRAILRAMSRPGEIVSVGTGLAPPCPLSPAAAATLLTLADFETPLWLSPSFSNQDLCAWLKFYTGAPIAASPDRAAYALVDAGELELSCFAPGVPEYPDRSTTVVLQVAALTHGGDLTLTGPGVKSARRFNFTPRPSQFFAQWLANGAAFPLGVDLILAAGDRLAGLPRTTRIAGAA